MKIVLVKIRGFMLSPYTGSCECLFCIDFLLVKILNPRKNTNMTRSRTILESCLLVCFSFVFLYPPPIPQLPPVFPLSNSYYIKKRLSLK